MANAAVVQLFGALFVLLFPGGRDVPLVTEAQSISDISDVYVKQGHNASFLWEASTGTSGLTIAIVAWSKDSASVGRLVGSTFRADNAYIGRVTQVGSAGIILSNVTKADEGNYTGRVTFSDGTPYTDSAQLEIAEKTESVTVLIPAATDVREGESVTLTCSSTGGNPPPSYIWLKDGKTDDSSTTNTLVINSFQTENAGVYSCIASNVAGNVTSSNTVQLMLINDSPGQPNLTGEIVGGTIGGIAFIITIGAAVYVIYRKQKGCMRLKVNPLPGRKVDVEWTDKSDASYKVLYRSSRNPGHEWTNEEVPRSDEYPNYKYTVSFPKDGSYEVCVLVNNERKSDIIEVEVRDDAAAKSEQSMPVSPLPGNNAPKSDVVFIKEGQSQQVKLAPIVSDKQKPTKKKKKKGKKMNKVNASDEDVKPED